MDKYNTPEISKGIYWVGVKDWDRKIFDALIPLPQGTTYNAYLVLGNDKTALIDTVNPGFENELVDKVNQITDLSKLDYLVMNHAEPDHAGAIPVIMEIAKDAKLITSKKGAKMAEIYYKIPKDRIETVEEESIDLGGKTLNFINAPWLHWPETMFTYISENKILFPCDFLGAHTAFGLYDEDVAELIPFAQRYFGEIMMPFSKMAKKALDMIKDLDIEMIAPSHGPIYKNPDRILSQYKKWTQGETKEKVIIIYVSMWRSTEKMIDTIIESLLSEGVEVCRYNLVNSDLGDIAKDLVDSRGIVLGMPTVLGGMHPAALYAVLLAKALRPPLKFGVVLSSYGWGGGALKQAAEILEPLHLDVVGTMEINGPPSNDNIKNIIEIGKQLSGKIKS